MAVLAGIGLLLLWARPTWRLLGFYAICIAILQAANSLLILQGIGLLTRAHAGGAALIVASDVGLCAGLFALAGAAIVALRGKRSGADDLTSDGGP